MLVTLVCDGERAAAVVMIEFRFMNSVMQQPERPDRPNEDTPRHLPQHDELFHRESARSPAPGKLLPQPQLGKLLQSQLRLHILPAAPSAFASHGVHQRRLPSIKVYRHQQRSSAELEKRPDGLALRSIG